MVNKPANIGTASETAVAKLCRQYGFVDAKRIAKTGAADTGDVEITRGLIAQVKGGKMGGAASIADVRAWWSATVHQTRNYVRMYQQSARAVLVVKRHGQGMSNAQNWRAYFTRDMINGTPLLQTTLGEYLDEYKQQPMRYLTMVGLPIEPRRNR